MIQHFVDKDISFHPAYVYNDVRAAVSHLHLSGAVGAGPPPPQRCRPEVARSGVSADTGVRD